MHHVFELDECRLVTMLCMDLPHWTQASSERSALWWRLWWQQCCGSDNGQRVTDSVCMQQSKGPPSCTNPVQIYHDWNSSREENETSFFKIKINTSETGNLCESIAWHSHREQKCFERMLCCSIFILNEPEMKTKEVECGEVEENKWNSKCAKRRNHYWLNMNTSKMFTFE